LDQGCHDRPRVAQFRLLTAGWACVDVEGDRPQAAPLVCLPIMEDVVE
jgi:hypothetical protein